MGPRQLRSFIAVAEELHFGRAAKLVHLSQPALSLQISGIEEELGVQLLIRNRRKTELTQAGTIFLGEAREVVQRMEEAITLTRRAALGQVGTLRIGFISTAAAILMPPLVKRFRERYEHVEMELRNVLTRDQVTQLLERKLDVGFLRVPLPTPPEIRTRVIHREPFVLLLPASHPLAAKEDLQLADCRGADFVMYTRKMAPGFHDQCMNILHQNGLMPHVVQEAAEMYTLISLVAAGLGIAIAPASIQLHQAENVVVRPLSGKQHFSEIAIAWNREHTSSTAQLFLKMAFEGSRPRKQAVEPEEAR
ncbi:transcriptional regulator, LysR family [Granulicella rosea]|uniref:Transcriptional regulator, LysR family n=1 Tax=Granulicella rosea TaxID=474952 RepID=A0A239EFS3_9BACT|nr:LysR family transcriptional regulator [Granulicella rosea]SNS43399.1 transcriptional regulator, LysR family [Granulicella rosea]